MKLKEKRTLHIIYDEKYFPLHMLLLFPQTWKLLSGKLPL